MSKLYAKLVNDLYNDDECIEKGGLIKSGSYQSIKGKIVSEWKIVEGHFNLHIEIPANTSAEIWIPVKNGNTVQENGKAVENTEGLRLIKTENGYAVFEVGSGSYHFQS